MKKLFALFCVACMMLTLVGCRNDIELNRKTKLLVGSETHSDFPGVYLEIVSIDDSREHPVLNARLCNQTSNTITYGTPYSVEIKDGDEWRSVLTAKVDWKLNEFQVLPWDSPEYRDGEMAFYLEFFDVSEYGTYRIMMDCNVITLENTENHSVPCLVWAEFDVIDPSVRTSHSIKMNDEDWLYEKVPSDAKVGDTVNVKIKKAYDVGYIFLVNGEQIGMEDYTAEYWLFSFTMPDEDVEIDFKTYDGFLPDVHYGTLIETFWLQNLDAEYVSIREYYGEYDDGAIVAMIDSCDYTANIWCEEVAGMDFMYGDGNRLLVLKDGTFHTLTEAYDKGLLSKESIENLFWRFFFQHSGLYADAETTVKVARPDLTIHTGPGYDNEDIGSLLDVGTYTITEQVVCDEGITWGKLKSGLGWIDLNKASDATQHIPITMERIDKELLGEMDCHLYLREETEYTQYLLIKPYEALTDVKLCFMNLAEDSLQPGETLYTLDKLDEDKPLVLGVVFYGDFTTFGLTLTDGEGNERQYMIYTSGRNGSIVLQEKE